MVDVNSTIVTVIGICVVAIIIILLLFYTWYRLRSDLAAYEANRDALLASAGGPPAPEDGAAGADGISAYEQYKIDTNQPLLTLSEFEDLFEGADGADGTDAPIAQDGAHGEDGSEGHLGAHGVDGAKGTAGADGAQGPSGDAFVTVYVSDDPDEDLVKEPILPAGPYVPPILGPNPGIGAVSPDDYPAIEFIYNSDPARVINYYKDGEIFIRFTVTLPAAVPGNPDAYLSYIIYNDSGDIIGFTSPITIPEYGATNNITVNFSLLATTAANSRIRTILSYNRGLTLSSFTQNIYEKNLDSKVFTYVNNAEGDPFVEQLNTIISSNALLKGVDEQFQDKVVISDKKTISGFLIKLT